MQRTPERKRELVINSILQMVKHEGFKTDKNLLSQLSKIVTADDFTGDKWVGGNIKKKCLEINYWQGKDKILKTKLIRL